MHSDGKQVIKCPLGKSGAYKIPNGVASIADDAFYECQKLTSVTFPASLKTIGESAFGYCQGLTSVTFPASLKTIGRYAFYRSGLMSLVIGNGVETIGFRAFVQCNELEWCVIGDSVTDIMNRFIDCPKLTTVTIGKSVSSVAGAFDGCNFLDTLLVADGNTYFTAIGGVLFNLDKTELVFCPPRKSGEYTVPDGVTYIADGAFAGCSKLTSVRLSSSVASTCGSLSLEEEPGRRSLCINTYLLLFLITYKKISS